MGFISRDKTFEIFRNTKHEWEGERDLCLLSSLSFKQTEYWNIKVLFIQGIHKRD